MEMELPTSKLSKKLADMKRAVFFDKDGTLIVDVPYNVDPARIRFQTGAIEALRDLREQGYLLILVSNQSGIAHGYFTENELENLKNKLQQLLDDFGVPMDAIYFCPHHPNGVVTRFARECECRKPRPGMLVRAAADHAIDLTRSWMVGDILNDVEAGTRAGCRTILVDNGNETEWKFSAERLPAIIVKNLVEAAERIIHERQLA